MIWSRYPLFRIFLFFAAGILCYNFFPLAQWFILLLLGSGFFLLLIFLIVFKKQIKSLRNIVLTIALLLLFFSFGAGISGLYLQDFNHAHLRFKNTYQEEQFYLVQVTKAPRLKEKSISLQVKLIATAIENGEGQAMLYIRKNKAAQRLKYGDRIWVKTQLSFLEPPKNPYEFDYRDYLNLKAIYFQSFVDSTQWKFESSGHGNALIAGSINLRNQLMKKLELWDLASAEAAITKALLLGYRDEVDDELLASYSAAGATHVLAVSGLHVGIIYVVAGYLLFFLKGRRLGELVRSILLVLLLWCYALLTGLSPSVVRAATMFTFVAVGSNLGKKTSIYNTILVSAFLLLALKPTYLFEVGFQLSYLAVFGIVWLQPRFQSVWQPKSWVLRQVWGISTVSLAAQIATFPMGLYYFHQFPGLFLVSNLMVIPLVTLLMYIGLSTLVLQLIYGLWIPLLWCYNGLLQLMNTGVRWVQGFDGFLWNQIHINRVELVVFYLLIGFFFTWVFRGGYRKLTFVLLLSFMLMSYQWFEEWQVSARKETIIYHTSQGVAIGIYAGGEGLLLADSLLLQDDDALTFHIKHHWWATDVDEMRLVPLSTEVQNDLAYKKGGFIQTKQTSILLYENQRKALEADVWLIRNYGYPPDEAFLVNTLVFTKRYLAHEAWQEWAQKQGVAIQFLEDGALEY